jgi:RNA polymerase sigma factor (sigma-70 family)
VLRVAEERRPGGAVPSPEAALLDSERRSELLEAVEQLPEADRIAIACRYFLDLSEAETAQVLDWPLGSVKSRTSRALNRLRGLLVAGQQNGVSRG